MIRARVISPFLSLIVTTALLGASSKLSPDLQSLDPNANVRVIVQYSQATPVSSQSGGLPGGGLLGGVLNLVGGLVNSVLGLVNAIVCTVPASSLESLASNPNVTYISPDRPVASQLDYSAAAVNASAAWKAKLTGSGIGVAVIDSGIDVDPDLSVLGLLPRVVYTQDFTGGNGKDEFGHGTHVAGIIAANGIESECSNCKRSFVGIAPSASLISLRVLDETGSGSDSTVIQAIQTAINLKKTYNIRVINLSLGRPIYESYAHDPLCQAVEAAWKAGIVVVVAAGNDGRDNSAGTNGYGTIESPGNDPYVITVGAMKAMGTYPRTDDLVASYSSKGPSGIDHIVKPDIVAPGNQVVSLRAPGSTLASEPANAVPLSYYESTASSTASSTFLMLNGTSMATPVVSGAAADLLQAHPSLTPDQVKARLMKTAYKNFPVSSTAVDPVTGQTFVSQYDVLTIGAGYLDIAAALANDDLPKGTAMSPTAVYNAGSNNVYLAFDPSSTWNTGGADGAWGVQTVWGTTVVDANLAIWGAQAVWNDSTVSGFRALWGAQGVWGTNGAWAASTTSANRALWGAGGSVTDSDTNFTVQN